jgi:hypothetical protein
MRPYGGRLAEVTGKRPVKRHKHLWGKVIALENLAAAARAALRGKRSTLSGAAFFGQWETEVVKLVRELREGSYAPGEYHYFEITDPKPRVIAAAPFRDRVVHHALVQVLEPLFEPRFIDARMKAGHFCHCHYSAETGFIIEEYHHPLGQVFMQYPGLKVMETRMIEQALGTKVDRKEDKGSQGVKCTIYHISTLG